MIDSYTKLLLHGDGTDGSVSITDEIGKTVTVAGSTQIDTAQKVFGTGSILFDGTTDYLTVADSADWYFGTGDFTIDFRVRFHDPTKVINYLVAQETNADNGFILYHVGTENKTRLAVQSGGSSAVFLDNSWTPTADTWYHFAVVRYGNEWKMYVNGSQIGNTVTDSSGVEDYTGSLRIGGRESDAGSGREFNGWIDELRISKGIARWTSNFTPPTSAYPLTLIDNLVSYWKLDESSGDASDSVGGNTGTNTSITYSTGKINNGAVNNGTGKLVLSSLPVSGHTDFTVSCWIKTSDYTTDYGCYWIMGSTGANASCQIFVNKTDGIISGSWSGGGGLCSTGVVATVGSWFHVVQTYTASDDKIRMYINDGGVSVGGANVGTLSGTNACLILGGYDGTNWLPRGTIDEVGVWSRVLCSEEVSQLYNSGYGSSVLSLNSNSGGDGKVYATSATYLTAHDATTGTAVSDEETQVFCQHEISGGTYQVTRYFFPFDTSSLPDNCIVVGGIFSWYFTNANAPTTYNPDSDSVSIIQTSQASPTSLTGNDFDNVGTTKGATDIAFADIPSSAGYVNHTLNATGLSWVSSSGYTYLGIRNARDISSSAPTNRTYLNAGTFANSATNKPKLVVFYQIYVPPTTNASFLLLMV
jgi:hypothetical protein